VPVMPILRLGKWIAQLATLSNPNKIGLGEMYRHSLTFIVTFGD
jgi:hypothetical protein